MRIIDFHTHAFPDALAGWAVPRLEEEGRIKAVLDGKISSLLKSMEETGVEKSVVCSIATKPEQFSPILKWSESIASDRLIPFPSVHPADPEAAERIRLIRERGFQGIKLHPYYQSFDVDEERMFPLYEQMERCGLIVVFHTDFDIAFTRDRKGDPARIVRVMEAFPKLLFVTTHIGAWEDRDEVRRLLLGKPIYTEISYSIPMMGAKRARELLLAHPADYVLFGTDSPWAGQRETLDYLLALKLGEERERKILYENAVRLLAQQAKLFPIIPGSI